MNREARMQMDALLQRHVPATCPALSLCVIHRGEAFLQIAHGFIDPDSRRLPVTTETRFDLASVTKVVVETAFLRLVESKAISLDTPLVAVIPEFGALTPRTISGGQDPHTRIRLPVEAAFHGLQADPAAVTFRHLITHTSGLPPWRSVYAAVSDDPPPPPQPGAVYADERWRKGLAEILRLPFVAPIGDSVRYSDIGLMLLGEAVARIAGCRLDEALAKLILLPLNLTSFTYNPLLAGVRREMIAPTENDHVWRKRRIWGEVHDENACGLGGIAGHAGLFAKAADVARFGQAWLTGDERLGISPHLRREATIPQAEGQFRMGLGWMLKAKRDASAGDLYSGESYGHTGFTGTSLWIDPRRQLVTALLTNRVWHGRDADAIHELRRAMHDLIVRAVESG